ncbi:ABC transporter substrate-binding protein [Nocardiopsis sediminis]|uniref:ABC transporter substrate-binding protein n=2 Tax=Nocardiopsis sediminis TaxID=1778267 RepID=A0ABV8FWC0_9ACTN
MRTKAAVPAAVLTLALAGCGLAAGESDSGLQTLTLQASDSYTQLPIRFGVEKGFFEEAGIEVEFTNVDDAVTGAAQGDLSFAFGPTSEFLRAAEQGVPIKIISSAFRSKGPYWLIADKDIESIDDLRGRQVGNSTDGSNLDTVLRHILQEEGLDPDEDVTLVNAGVHEQAYGALTTGQVDATIIHQPFPALGELEGETVTLARGWEYLPTYHTGVLIAGESTIESDPELLRNGLEAYFRSYTYAKEHYDEYLPWLKEQLDTIDGDAVEAAIEAEDPIWDANPAIDREAIRDTQEIEIEVGHQDGLYDAEAHIDERFIPEEYVKPFDYEFTGTEGGDDPAGQGS